MNEDFQKRLAKLEAKNGHSEPPAYQPPNTPQAPTPSGGSGGGKGGMFKILMLGLACLIVLPVGAAFATIYLPQIKDGADRAMAFVEVWKELDGDGSPEQRKASREVEGVVFRMTTGTMSKKEETYWGSAEGRERLRQLEIQSSQIDNEKLLSAGKRLYGID